MKIGTATEPPVEDTVVTEVNRERATTQTVLKIVNLYETVDEERSALLEPVIHIIARGRPSVSNDQGVDRSTHRRQHCLGITGIEKGDIVMKVPGPWDKTVVSRDEIVEGPYESLTMANNVPLYGY